MSFGIPPFEVPKFISKPGDFMGFTPLLLPKLTLACSSLNNVVELLDFSEVRQLDDVTTDGFTAMVINSCSNPLLLIPTAIIVMLAAWTLFDDTLVNAGSFDWPSVMTIPIHG